VEALLATLAQRGSGKPVTMIFASHNMGQVKRLASRVLYLQAGRLLADLPTADFFNPAVLREASAAAHAFLEGEVV
jgi:tungstate transport system ATP-binding protein